MNVHAVTTKRACVCHAKVDRCMTKTIDQKILVKLIDRLNRYPVGLPDTPVIREFLELFLSEDEAFLASTFPMRETTAVELAKKVGWDVPKVEGLLEKMAEQGTIVDFIVNNKDHYWFLTPSIIGFIEFSLMKLHEGKPMKELARLLKEYEENDLWKEVFGGRKTQLTRALVEYDVPITSEVMTYASVEKVIKASGGGAVQTCFCRHQAELIGEPCRVAGHDGTCIALGRGAEFMIRRGFGRKASVEELLDITKKLGEKGLIHVTDNIRDNPGFICNCCGCCCGLLAAIKRKNVPHAVSPTPFILKIDQEKCIGCSACAKRCQISAITVKDKKAFLDGVNCLGCGSCVKFCKNGALSLIERKKRPKLPKNTGTRFLKMAFEKGRLRHLFPDMLRSKMGKF